MTSQEDEILKAAVQKYGKQQWARVASLLNRKSAKQCKARWHEWLDPSVRKVEWNRAEEEKLLHLSKLMPAQWKTIAPLVGRTASQCQEHYESLLDQVATAAGQKDAGAEGGTASPSLRSFQPGQIDSHPETKPARPDPIGMDEDEIEMLQEARARLANTQGKKAKRKAREKMLAQAKRLADLQKRRELKQAGLMSSAARKTSRKKSQDIDLGVEIPFHKPAPTGFHDTSAEAAQGEAIRRKRRLQVDFKKVNENLYRTRDREAGEAKRREQARLRALEKSNMQYVVMKVSKKNDPLQTKTRGMLQLPVPAVNDKELGQLAKLQTSQQVSGGVLTLNPSLSSATQALLGNYSDRPLPTPMRTPATAGSKTFTQESILREASKLRELERVQTPFLVTRTSTEEEARYDDQDDENFDTTVSSQTPRLNKQYISKTPDPAGKRTQTPLVAPPRDELGLNRRTGGGDDMSVGASTFATSTMAIRDIAREERRAAKRARLELEQALAALPAPQYEYELAVSQDEGDDMDVGGRAVEKVEMDAAEVEAAELKFVIEAEKRCKSRKCDFECKELPIPRGCTDASFMNARDEAEVLIQQKTAALRQHDASDFAEFKDLLRKKKKYGRVKVPLAIDPAELALDHIQAECRDSAKASLQVELEQMLEDKTAVDASTASIYNRIDALEYAQHKVSREVFLKNSIESLKMELKKLRDTTTVMRTKNDKTEAKLMVIYKGYSKRETGVLSKALQSFTELQNVVIRGSIYSALESQEIIGERARGENLENEIANLECKEVALQQHYNCTVLKKNHASSKQKEVE